GGTNARTVITGFVVGAVYKTLYYGAKLWKETIAFSLYRPVMDETGKKVVGFKGFVGGLLAIEISPELLGVGYIIGPRVAGVTFAGGVLSYLILIPAIKFFGVGLNLPFAGADPSAL